MPLRFLPVEPHAWSDDRGWGVRPFEVAGVDGSHVGEFHVVSVEPGAIRGNHLHPNVTEWLLICGAPSTFAWREGVGPIETRTLPGTEPVLVEIPPDVAHTVRCDGPGTALLVSWADGRPETRRVTPLLLAPAVEQGRF